MINTWVPEARSEPGYDDIQLENLRQHAASCRIEETELIEDLLKVKETELNCYEMEQSHLESIAEFERTKTERSDMIQGYIKSYAALSQTVGETQNGVGNMFAVEVSQREGYKIYALNTPPPLIIDMRVVRDHKRAGARSPWREH